MELKQLEMRSGSRALRLILWRSVKFPLAQMCQCVPSINHSATNIPSSLN